MRSIYDNDKIWEAVNKVLEPEHIRVECLSYDLSVNLNDDYTGYPGQENIIDNPKHFTFTEIASSSMINILDDVDAGFAYSNNAVDAGLDPNVDPILQDKLDLENNEERHKYIIIFTGVKGDENNEVYKKVIDAYHTDGVYKVYKELFEGARIPVDNGKAVDLSQY